MKAIGYYTAGSIDREDSLVDLELPTPEPGAHDLLVRVKAISVNPIDYKVRSSMQPENGQAKVIGYDASGIVEAVGGGVTLFKPGDEVFYAGDITRPGANSEFHLVDERIVGRKPGTLDWAESAAIPLTSITAWEMLFDHLRVPYGQKTQKGALLVINGAGGVGSMLIQLARRLTGLTVVATASRPDTEKWVRKFGAHYVINHRKPLSEELRGLGIEYAEYVAALTASDKHHDEIVKLIAPQGYLVMTDDPKVFDIMPFKRKAVGINWEFMFARSMHKTPDMIEQHHLLNEVSALLDAGVLKTTLNETLSPINAANLKLAHARVEGGASIGKTVVVGF